LGSTSAVAHGVAGTILTYMRSFNVGDFVKIGDTVGEVREKTLLVTRIFTQKKRDSDDPERKRPGRSGGQLQRGSEIEAE
jgi:small-conductance mechanosensitive channel